VVKLVAAFLAATTLIRLEPLAGAGQRGLCGGGAITELVLQKCKEKTPRIATSGRNWKVGDKK
jgi:hypothetical protein